MASEYSLYKLFVTLMLFDYICLGGTTHAVGKKLQEVTFTGLSITADTSMWQSIDIISAAW